MTTRAQLSRQKKAFLDSFRTHGNVSRACRESGCERRNIYRWQEHDEAFSMGFKQAEVEATETLEAEAHRRAVEGTHRLKFDRKGDPLRDPETGGYYRELEYSDTLLIFLLKARAPEKYRDRYDVTSGGQPLQAARDRLLEDIQREADLVIAERARAAALAGGDDRSGEPEDTGG